MSSINKVILIGHLGADPEIRATSSGDSICNLRVATSEKWKDRASGEAKEQTEWHRVVLFRQLADIARQYLKKGAMVYLEGRLRTRKWTDREGQERYTTEIEASEMRMLGGRSADAVSAPAPAGQKVGDEPWNAPGASQKINFDTLDVPF